MSITKYYEFASPGYALVAATDTNQALMAYDKEFNLKEGQEVSFSISDETQVFQLYKELLSNFVPLNVLDKEAKNRFSEVQKEESAVLIVEH
ncbi:hypothetical protein [Enterococcus faecalis]|uniref:hypothetical protein n=1 Tax=Enterococcus TaxID=1350 RepID=UPI0018831795|nr:hypothetical protein [Enterococcus faecalis]MBF0006434.1 hypothetical protein [Enterococcus faecalis]MBF0009117.1 hypothetical protein [Enterococcus faecalis]MBF0018398.1 hypothetical protein [Enterococcus faecalis]